MRIHARIYANFRIPIVTALTSLLLCGANGENMSKAAEKYYWSGKENYRNGKYQEAINDYDKAAIFSPKTAKIFGSRAAAKRKLGDKDGALADARKAAQLGDKDAQRILRLLGKEW